LNPTFECVSRRTSLYNISVYSYSLATKSLASLVHSYGADAWGSLISLFMAWTIFSLPCIVCYRWREFGGITIIGSYYGFIRPLYSPFFILSISSVREISSSFKLVFESFYQHIDHDIAYYERAQRAIHLYDIPVDSYLRSILTATLFIIFYSFHFMCSRDFILYMNAFMVLWYYGIMVLWYYGIMVLCF